MILSKDKNCNEAGTRISQLGPDPGPVKSQKLVSYMSNNDRTRKKSIPVELYHSGN